MNLFGSHRKERGKKPRKTHRFYEKFDFAQKHLETTTKTRVNMSAIPTSMPYTIDDILGCKTCDEKTLKKDYESLVKFDALTNPRKFCGNKIIYHHQLLNLLNCRRDGKKYKTIMEIFADDELREKLWKDTVKRNRRDKAPYPNPTDVYECHRINTGAIVPFKASTAKYIYKKFNATSVLDFTAGWGGRLLGASSLGIKYTGYDTNTNLKKGYDDMMELLNIQNCEMRWKSSAGEDFGDLEYDLILTSPPYVNMELYENMTPFESDVKFYNEFLIPLMSSAFDGMNDGGHMCINISPKMYDALILHGFPGCDDKIDLRQQLGQQYKTKSQDYIYVWNKPEEYKYNGDDWAWGYGFTVKDGEYRVTMAGGGEHWESYVITKDRCYIDNTHGEHNVKNFIACPDGDYMKVIHLGEDYELEEGETDMHNMVQESYIDEIMNYEDSDDEEDEEDEELSKDEIIAKLRADIEFMKSVAEVQSRWKEDVDKSVKELQAGMTALEEDITNIQSCLKSYWSDGELGDCDAWSIPDEWEDELEELSKYEDDEIDYYIDAGRKVVLKDGTIKNTK